MDRPADPSTEAVVDGRDDLDSVVQRVGRGDEGAFAVLYDALSAQVFGLARRVVRDPAQAEEVTQEVFLELWRVASRFDPSRGSVRSWVLTITHRRSVDRVRSAQASADRTQRMAASAVVRPFDEVVEQVESRSEAQAVRSCLSTLTELQRQAIQLAYYGGHTYAEVAGLLSVPLGTVKTRLRDGLIRLRNCLAPA
jgi:RNA polymerase sigma-70 factor (ECF subfamily)